MAEAKGRLFTGGDALTAATNTLESAVLLVRVANWRFLATFDPNGPATFAKNVEKAEAGLKVFQEAEGDAAFTPRIQAVADTLGAYGRDFRATASALDLLKTVFETGIKPLTSQIEEASTAARDLIKAALEENAQAVEKARWRARATSRSPCSCWRWSWVEPWPTCWH
ncbi:hypothetical protein MKK63_18515 [Methylobacterium sp. J-088]|uniref:hypothetical protein n=1 Tax=Methylobacterium sp. J-088 TaxID=2836664 RepID=UPI001FBB22AE|nr:hypothetical protein [Methylobacterium sp. J-088]MCJ2064691.1 hypothetical protein [Methylobacterium sp. J-088]